MTELKSEQIMRDIEYYIDSGVPYIDAIVDYAEREGLEIEVVGEIIRRSPVLKSKIYDEAEKLNMVERTARLPV
jgi:predicted aldo/keto reductase-like oxidoreductase